MSTLGLYFSFTATTEAGRSGGAAGRCSSVHVPRSVHGIGLNFPPTTTPAIAISVCKPGKSNRATGRPIKNHQVQRVADGRDIAPRHRVPHGEGSAA